MNVMTSPTRNEKVLIGLRASATEGRLPHALILSGPESLAKVDCVERFAAWLFAQSGGEEAALLERIRRGNHPDFTRLEPVNGTLGVDEVRGLPRLLAFPPLEAGRRIVLLPAAALNTQAANAILKILEEPPAHSMFFLLCRDPAELLQTIVSRCQTLRFGPLDDKSLLVALAGQGEDNAHHLLAWSEGSAERARFLLTQEDALALREAACERLVELWEASPRIPSSCAAWIDGIESEEQTRVVLDSWDILLRDLAFTAAGAGAQHVRFRDFYPRLVKLAALAGEAILREASAKSEAIHRFRVYRSLNGNLRLDFAALLAELQIFSVGKSPLVGIK